MTIETLPSTINTPTWSTPVDGATDVKSFTFTASAFAIVPPEFDTHLNTDWEFATDAEFTNIIASALSSSQLKSITLAPSFFPVNTVIYVRVRYRGEYLLSEWSQISFTTAEAYTHCNEQAILTASASYGRSVAISGDTAIVGAYRESPEGIIAAGSAYVYIRVGTTWIEQAVLTASDKASLDYFGYSVAISGDTAIVGAYHRDSDGLTHSGGAYIYTRTGTAWAEQTVLTASDKSVGDCFGGSVAISDDIAIVGSRYNDSAIAGSAYIYIRTDDIWTEQAVLITSNTDARGISVAISRYTAVGDAHPQDSASAVIDAGGAYIFAQ